MAAAGPWTSLFYSDPEGNTLELNVEASGGGGGGCGCVVVCVRAWLCVCGAGWGWWKREDGREIPALLAPPQLYSSLAEVDAYFSSEAFVRYPPGESFDPADSEQWQGHGADGQGRSRL